MSQKIRAYAITKQGGDFERYDFDPGPLGADRVEVAVEYCGVCHSDLSMVKNDWGMTAYPLVPGHEVVGKITAVGEGVTTLKPGQTVGVGWYSGSCLHCKQCMSGDQNLCLTAESTIVGRHGGFADRVRCQAAWAVPLPDGVDIAKAGPLFCGGITVFNPLVQFDVRPTDRVGVIGIGGLGHMALKFLRAWGCEVVAFTSSDGKRDEAMKLGAHRVINSRDESQLNAAKGTFDLILNTVNASMNWPLYVDCLSQRGRLHTVGAVAEPISLGAFPLIMGQKSLSGSPLGSPATTAKMLEFCARHQISPVTETFPMSKVNEAFAHLEAGKARFRIVLANDF
ncbi:NADPH-dependent aldehyde reductase Ahr [Zavarzinella formosa]|uniref:NADPH-dependent aldehyde reductase Ahr n=1 Tax=Zavarzinella formosa TaxID=360055 RepID=UPI0003085714|nr:NAD(P)-dependent alcohol dehydrogenase [Zavarzinella formosa]